MLYRHRLQNLSLKSCNRYKGSVVQVTYVGLISLNWPRDLFRHLEKMPRVKALSNLFAFGFQFWRIFVFIQLIWPLCWAAESKCYQLDGSINDGDFPCDPSADHSVCCGSDWACLENGLCQNTQYINPDLVEGTNWLGSCTDRTWSSIECLNECDSGSFFSSTKFKRSLTWNPSSINSNDPLRYSHLLLRRLRLWQRNKFEDITWAAEDFHYCQVSYNQVIVQRVQPV